MVCFGENYSCQLGCAEMNVFEPKCVLQDTKIVKMVGGMQHTLVLRSDGTLLGSGINASGQLALKKVKKVTNFTVIVKDEQIKDIFCGATFSFILKSNGSSQSLFGFGSNDRGELGIGTTRQSYVPVLIIKEEKIKQVRFFGLTLQTFTFFLMYF